MSISVFLSTVTDEFGAYRVKLEGDLTRHDVAVKVQERFKDLGGDTLDKLDTYIAHCDAVVHLVGEMCGAAADKSQQEALVAKYPDLPQRLPPLGRALAEGAAIPYTHWEAWLALYHKKPLMIAKAAPAAPRGPRDAPTDGSRASQAAHLAGLKAFHRYPGCEFESPDDLARHIAYSAILDLLVKDYAEKTARERDVAEGFIKEMAKRVAGDKALDFDGMKRAVENAIEIYEKEIAGKPTGTNFDDVVDRALTRAKEQVDRGQSRLARNTLRRAADQMRREEEERHERYVAGVSTLYARERDIALAAYDGEAAGEAIIELAQALNGEDATAKTWFLDAEAKTLLDFGHDRGSNVHLIAAIAVRREVLALASSGGERGAANHGLGNALCTLGERESGTARLEEAVAAYRAALEERKRPPAQTRARVPFDWAATQNDLGTALQTLGARESGTARLEKAVAAYRAALEVRTRDRVPFDWAMTQNNLGNALSTLGARESGTARLNEATEAYRAALQVWTREQVPDGWATIQFNLGNTLKTLGERESGTARLEDAVAAYRSALKEWLRERDPLDWADAQVGIGNVLLRLGERESGTLRLEEAIQAYRAALGELTQKRDPLGWATTQTNLGNALLGLGKRQGGTVWFEQAIQAYRAALEESRRERVPLAWAGTQMSLGNALLAVGERESGTARFEEAVAAYRASMEEWTRERVPLDWAAAKNNLGDALLALGERENGTARFEEAIEAYRAALEELTRERVPLDWACAQHGLANALASLAKRKKNPALLEGALAFMRGAVDAYQQAGEGFSLPIAQRCLDEMEAELAGMKVQTKDS